MEVEEDPEIVVEPPPPEELTPDEVIELRLLTELSMLELPTPDVAKDEDITEDKTELVPLVAPLLPALPVPLVTPLLKLVIELDVDVDVLETPMSVHSPDV